MHLTPNQRRKRIRKGERELVKSQPELGAFKRKKFNRWNNLSILGYSLDYFRKNRDSRQIFPDLFFDWIHLKMTGNDWFGKSRLVRSLEGRVRHPYSIQRTFWSPFRTEGKESRWNRPVNDLHAMINKTKGVYVKPLNLFFSHGGRGIIRIRKRPDGYEMIATPQGEWEQIIRVSFPKSTYAILSDGSLFFPARSKQKELEQLGRIVRHTMQGSMVIEQELKIPLIKGKTWEIRFLIQSPTKKPEILFEYAKIGAGPFVANIKQGGTRGSSVWVISTLYSNLYPHASKAKIGLLVQDFFKRSTIMVGESVRAINEDMRVQGKSFVPGFPSSELYVREAAVDITAEINPKTGKLDPVLMEFQYPSFGSPDLEKTHPIVNEKMVRNRGIMIDEGRKVLERFLKP